MAEFPDAYVVHETPSRLRLKVPTRRRDTAFFCDARRRLSEEIPGARIDVNPRTASILIYAPHAGRAIAALSTDGPFRVCNALQAAPTLQGLSAQAASINESVRRLSGGLADARSYIVAGLIVTALVQIARGRVFAPAVTLLWYAGQAVHAWTPASEESPR